MNKNGEIIIIEDDTDDKTLFKECFNDLGFQNKLTFITDGEAAFKYLSDDATDPFLIISDINLPKLNGFQLRERIHDEAKLSIKCVPYIFFSTTTNHRAIVHAYSSSVQGFFTKPQKINELKEIINAIMVYWIHCSAPDFSN